MATSFRNLAASARAAHQSLFGDLVEYAYPGGAAKKIRAKPHRERIETRQSGTGTQRVTAREFHVDRDTLADPRLDGTITFDGHTYAIETTHTLRSGTVVLLTRRTQAAEISRPNYRGKPTNRIGRPS